MATKTGKAWLGTYIIRTYIIYYLNFRYAVLITECENYTMAERSLTAAGEVGE